MIPEKSSAVNEVRNDKNLMPPPPAPNTNENAETNSEGVEKRKLDTPLAAMLPSKYADIDVTQLFPDFRHGKVSH